MKMFSTQLAALVAIVTAASIQAKSVSLVSRQLAPAIPGIPVPCQPICIVFTTLQQSITPQQSCTATNSANIGRCAQCVMTMNTSSVVGNAELMNQLQGAVNSFTSACAAAGIPVPPITLVNPLTQQPLLGNGALPTPGVPLPGAPLNVVAPPGAVETRADVKVMGTHSIPMAPVGAPGAQPLPGAQFGQPPVGTPFPPGTPVPPGTQPLLPNGQLAPAQGFAGAPPPAIPGIANFQQREKELAREQEIQRERAAGIANFEREREREEAIQRQRAAGIASFGQQETIQREQEALRLREQEALRLREQEALRLREQEALRLREQEALRLREQAGIASRERFGGRPIKRSLPNNPVALLRRIQQSPSSASAPSSPKGNGAIGRMDTRNVRSMMILIALGLLVSWIV